MRFFFYGTLIDPDVRRLVLGDAAPHTVEEARLRGWERREIVDATYPILVAHPDGRVDGVLARGIGTTGRSRLIAYEGDGYRLNAIEVELADGRRKQALVFGPAPVAVHRPGSRPWDFDAWRRQHKATFLRELAREAAIARPTSVGSAR